MNTVKSTYPLLSYMYLPKPKRFKYVLTKKHLGQQLIHTTMIDNSSTYYDSHTPHDKVTAPQLILPEISVLSAFSAPVTTPLFVFSREVEHFANFCALVRLKESVHS